MSVTDATVSDEGKWIALADRIGQDFGGNHIAALDATSGNATAWNPGADSSGYAIGVTRVHAANTTTIRKRNG